MPLIHLVLVLVLLGVLLYLIETFIPMDSGIKTIIRVVVVIAVILWLLAVFGFGTGVRVGSLSP